MTLEQLETRDCPTVVAHPDHFAFAADAPIRIRVADLRANDTIPPGTSPTVERLDSPAGGQLDRIDVGLWQYTPGTGFTGSDAFRYRLFDGTDYSLPALVTFEQQPAAPSTPATPTVTDVTEAWLTGFEDEALGSVTVAVFETAEADVLDWTARIDWGDGTTTTGQIVADGDGRFRVVGEHTYDEWGLYLVQVTLTDTAEATHELFNLASIQFCSYTHTFTDPVVAGSGLLSITGVCGLTFTLHAAALGAPTGYEYHWHHLIPQQLFDESNRKFKEVAKHLKEVFGADYVHSADNGWYLMLEDHIRTHQFRHRVRGGKELRSWNDDWEKFFLGFMKNGNGLPSKNQILNFLEQLKMDYGFIDKKGNIKLGAAVAKTDKLTYDEHRLSPTEKAALRKQRNVSAWQVPFKEREAAAANYQARLKAKATLENTKAAMDGSTVEGRANQDKKTKLGTFLAAAGTALAVSGPVAAATRVDDAKLMEDLLSAQSELAMAHRAKSSNPTLATVHHVEFATKIKNIMVNHFGLDETTATFLVYMVQQGIIGELIPLP